VNTAPTMEPISDYVIKEVGDRLDRDVLKVAEQFNARYSLS